MHVSVSMHACIENMVNTDWIFDDLKIIIPFWCYKVHCLYQKDSETFSNKILMSKNCCKNDWVNLKVRVYLKQDLLSIDNC